MSLFAAVRLCAPPLLILALAVDIFGTSKKLELKQSAERENLLQGPGCQLRTVRRVCLNLVILILARKSASNNPGITRAQHGGRY